jgi:hypothetical protein
MNEVELASMVLFGSPTNANEDKETTDLKIEAVIKDHRERGGRNVITLKRYIPPTVDGAQYKYLVFLDMFEGQMRPYRGVAFKPNSRVPDYLRKALPVKDQPVGKRLRFYFNYLDSDDLEVSSDAYREFANCDYKDYKDMAKSLPADRLVRWLRDPNTQQYRLGLYASMLGHCGTKKDAAVLHHLLEDPDRRIGSGVDAMFAAYVLLDHEKGWKYLKDALKDGRHEFLFRFAALRAARFLYQYRDDVVSKSEIVNATLVLLKQDDAADMAVEDLRKWKRWDKADAVLAVRGTAAYRQGVVKRALLRYCLSCPGNAGATAYVAEQRRLDSSAVEEAEELLKIDEEEAAKPPKPPAKR